MSESIPPPVMPEPPAIAGPNVFPLDWTVDMPKIWDLYERAKRETWNPADLQWSSFNELLDLADASGISALTFDERAQLCHDTMLRLKRLMGRFDVPFPAIPEVGITGEETQVTPDDFVLVAL